MLAAVACRLDSVRGPSGEGGYICVREGEGEGDEGRLLEPVDDGDGGESVETAKRGDSHGRWCMTETRPFVPGKRVLVVGA